MFKSIALAALIATTLTSSASAGECRIACDNQTFLDFTETTSVGSWKWEKPTDSDSCQKLINQYKDEKKKDPEVKAFRARTCKDGKQAL